MVFSLLILLIGMHASYFNRNSCRREVAWAFTPVQPQFQIFNTCSHVILSPEFHIFHCYPRIPMPVVLRTSYHLVSRLIRTNDPTFPFAYSICCLLLPMAQRSQRFIMRLSWSNSGKTAELGWLSHLRHRGFWCCPTWSIRVRILDFLVVYFLPGPAVLTGAFIWAVFSEDAIAGSRCMLLAGCFGRGLEWWIHWESQSCMYLFQFCGVDWGEAEV